MIVSHAVEPYLARLRELPFVLDARQEAADGTQEQGAAAIVLRVPDGEHRWGVETVSGPVTTAFAERLAHRLAAAERRALVLAPHVGPSVGRRLAAQGISFVDLEGNCFVCLDGRYVAHVEGRKRQTQPARDRGIRAPGYRVLFALLATPDLVGAPLRRLASASGASRQAASDMIERLVGEGAVVRTASSRAWVPQRMSALLDRWIVGYVDALRPKLLLGRFRTPEADVDHREEQLAARLAGSAWRWGGASAARRLVGHYRAPSTTIHVHEPTADLVVGLLAVPEQNGPLVVLKTPGPVGLDGATDDTAHPLLVYAELLAEGHERATEAAGLVLRRYLPEGIR